MESEKYKCNIVDLDNLLGKYGVKDLEDLEDRLESVNKYKAQYEQKDRENLVLFTMLYEMLEKEDPENVASRLEQATKLNLAKHSEWYKSNRNMDEMQTRIKELIEQRDRTYLFWTSAEDKLKEVEKELYEASNKSFDNCVDKMYWKNLAQNLIENIKTEFTKPKLNGATPQTIQVSKLVKYLNKLEKENDN